MELEPGRVEGRPADGPSPGAGLWAPPAAAAAAAALPSDAAELHRLACDGRAREGARASRWAQPHFHPLLPRQVGGGVSTHAQSRPAEAGARETEWKEGVGA